MRYRLLLILFCVFCHSVNAQDENRIRSFEQKIDGSKNDADKIDALGALAEYYSIFNLQSKADSVLQKALFIAEISSDKELVLKILFNNTVSNLYQWSSKETFDRSYKFIEKGLQYAQDLKRDDYVVFAYIRLAGVLRKKHLYDEAAQQAALAMTSLANAKNDSLACILYMELGDIYIAKSDAVPAFKNYNNAFDIAYKQKNIRLQSEIYHRFSELYKLFGDAESGKRYLLQSLELNTKNNFTEGQFLDCIGLARITDERDYIDKASSLAEKLNSDRYKLSAKRLAYYWYMVNGKNSSQTLDFLHSNPDLTAFLKNSGTVNYACEMGNIFFYSSKYDSALVYFRQAENDLATVNSPSIEFQVYNLIAGACVQNDDSACAKKYYEKAFALCKEMNRLSSMVSICTQLKKIYAGNSNYKQAYYYSLQVDSVNNLLESNAARDKVVLLQVDQENKKRETDLLEATQKKEKRYYLQLMAITVMLTLIFALMLFVGMFAVSKTTIRLLGYFAFISLFEFIILILDHPIVQFTHGEPLKIWGIKILLITILVPCQHFMESRLIHFLQSRKLLEARQKFSFRNWWYRIKKPVPVSTGTDIEDDTAVL